MNCSRAEAVMIGDQLSTDVWGANAIGMSSYLVVPLAKEDLKHTLLIRKAENAILGSCPVESLNATADEVQAQSLSTSL